MIAAVFWRSRTKMLRAAMVALVAVLGAAFAAVAHEASAEVKEADFQLSRTHRFAYSVAGDSVEWAYLLYAYNKGPGTVSNFRLLVTTDATATIRIGTSFSSGTVCRAVTACARVFEGGVAAEHGTMTVIRVFAAPGTRITAEVRVPDDFTDPDPENNDSVNTLPDEADLGLTLVERPVEIFEDDKVVHFKYALHNGGPASLGTVRIRVETDDEDGTIWIGPEGSGSVCVGTTVCEYTYTVSTPFRAGGDLDISVRVASFQGTEVTVRSRTRGGFTDPNRANNDLEHVI
jgi:hypothetical protein